MGARFLVILAVKIDTESHILFEPSGIMYSFVVKVVYGHVATCQRADRTLNTAPTSCNQMKTWTGFRILG